MSTRISRVYEIFQSRVFGVTSGSYPTHSMTVNQCTDVRRCCSTTVMPGLGRGFGPGPGRGFGPGPGPGGAALRALADVPTSSPTNLPLTTNEDEETQEGTSNATNQVAPTIPVLNKIQPSAAGAGNPQPPKPKRIVVPQRSCNGGFDFKFDDDPQNVNLHDLLSPQDYEDAITTLNETIKKSRSTKLDAGLLVTGPLLVPLAVWGVRHHSQAKRRKKLLAVGINHFNDSHLALYMRWNKSGSCLSIQPRPHSERHEDSTAMTPVPLRTGLEDSNVFV